MSSMLCPQCSTVVWSTDLKCRNCGTTVPGTRAQASPVERVINEQPGPQYPPGTYAPPKWTPPPVPTWTPPPVPVSPFGAQPYAVGFRCPFCQSQSPPYLTQKISGAGWAVFILMLFFCFPLFWIGLLMKEDHRVCSGCGMSLG